MRTGKYGQLAHALLGHGLVDQLNFVIIPAMMGSSTTLCRPGKRTTLRLISVPERNGVLTLTYANASRTQASRQERPPGQTLPDATLGNLGGMASRRK